MKASVDITIPELERVDGGRTEFEWENIKYLIDNCSIDKQFANYVKGKEHGIVTSWDREGNITKTEILEHGKVIKEIK